LIELASTAAQVGTEGLPPLGPTLRFDPRSLRGLTELLRFLSALLCIQR
jgi:hypothetical protein